MGKIIASIVIAGLIGFTTFLLIKSIQEPIAFQAEKVKRSEVVASKLKQIKTLQEIYKSIKGTYAGSFEELVNVIKTEKIPFIKVVGNPDDPNNPEVTRSISYSSALDSVNALGIDLSNIDKVPYADGVSFSIQADTIDYQSTKVSVVEVGTKWKTFMGEFGTAKFKKYDAFYDPEKSFKFGDMNTPNLSGNW
jgi:uncharacterized protein with FMN-binding domain